MERIRGPNMGAGAHDLLMTITPAQARAYLDRWTEVRAIEIVELRRTSMEMKLRQLASLMESRKLFANDPQREQEENLVRDRWANLRQALNK